jgi:hypothetical protein
VETKLSNHRRRKQKIKENWDFLYGTGPQKMKFNMGEDLKLRTANQGLL